MKKIHLNGDMADPTRVIPPLAALLAFQRAGSLLSFRRAARDLALSPSNRWWRSEACRPARRSSARCCSGRKTLPR
jgi:hypothetical protein